MHSEDVGPEQDVDFFFLYWACLDE